MTGLSPTSNRTGHRPDKSIYFSTILPEALACYNLEDTERYLTRIGLPPSLSSAPPSLELLTTLSVAHHLSIPYDTSSMHVARASWTSPNQPISMRKGPGMELGEGNFDRIVNRSQGGFCYALNTSFAALLRGWGFKVSECGARVYFRRGKDPKVVGYHWSATTHETLLVDWEGSEGRYVVDVGFGGGMCPYPILLKDGQTSRSLSLVESFLLKEEKLQIDFHDLLHPDVPSGFTIYRRVLPKGMIVDSPEAADSGPGYWTPCYHFTLSSLCPTDIHIANYYNESHWNAVWAGFFLVTRLLPSGARRTLAYGGDLKESIDKGQAKLYTKDSISGDEVDVEWVDFETEAIGSALRKEFGFIL